VTEIYPWATLITFQKAADIIRSWNHFALVQNTPPFPGRDADWRSTSLWPLPDWLGISRMVSETDALYFHSAILWLLKAKYWVGTHDEVKRSGGFLAPFLRRKVLTFQEALEKEKNERGLVSDQSDLADMKGVRFAALQSGESLLLE